MLSSCAIKGKVILITSERHRHRLYQNKQPNLLDKLNIRISSHFIFVEVKFSKTLLPGCLFTLGSTNRHFPLLRHYDGILRNSDSWRFPLYDVCMPSLLRSVHDSCNRYTFCSYLSPCDRFCSLPCDRCRV